jgi:hypothetical protein
MAGPDTEKIKEIDRNQKFCDDRYVSWRWTIAGAGAAVLLVASLSWGLSQWGAKVNSEIDSGKEFRIQYQAEITILRQTVNENHHNLDTIKTILRSPDETRRHK